MFQITVSRVFCAAHAIRLPDGSLEPLHGHNWAVELTVGAQSLDGMEVVMDFHVLQQRVDDLLGQVNNRNLNEVAPFAGGKLSPTAERVAWWLGTEVAKGLPEHVRLVSVQVTEAPGCVATYRP